MLWRKIKIFCICVTEDDWLRQRRCMWMTSEVKSQQLIRDIYPSVTLMYGTSFVGPRAVHLDDNLIDRVFTFREFYCDIMFGLSSDWSGNYQDKIMGKDL